VRIDLGGIGKGYAVDRAAAILRSRGVSDFMIQSGGDLYVAGRRGDRSWRAGIQDPRGPAGSIFAALDLSDSAFSTSGDYERFFMKDGRRYHHIIDPKTGKSPHGVRSVTIIAPENLPASMPAGASAFYARNISALLLGMVKDGALDLDFEDEVTKATVITKDGEVISEAVKKLLEPGGPA